MVNVNGKPFVWYLLEQLADKGINRFLLLTGYLGQTIRDYFGSGEKWGWEIDYNHGPAEWDTGRRLWEARDYLENEFLLAYSDNFVQIRLDLLAEVCLAGLTKLFCKLRLRCDEDCTSLFATELGEVHRSTVIHDHRLAVFLEQALTEPAFKFRAVRRRHALSRLLGFFASRVGFA